MNGIKMSDCRFYVNEEERVVVCVIPNTGNMVENFIMENFDFKQISIPFGLAYDYIEKHLRMPPSFMGKAVCAEGDEWNEEVGRKIAFLRAKDKCYKSFFRHANHFVQMVDRRLNDMIESFNTLGMKLEDKHQLLQKEIEESIEK